MDDYLSKPVDPQKLFAAVEGHRSVSDTRGAVPFAVPAFDEDALLNRVSGDTALMTEVISLFLDTCPAQLAAIKDAVTSRNAHDLRSAAHALKGAAGNLSPASACPTPRTSSNGSAPSHARGRGGSRVAAIVGRGHPADRCAAEPSGPRSEHAIMPRARHNAGGTNSGGDSMSGTILRQQTLSCPAPRRWRINRPTRFSPTAIWSECRLHCRKRPARSRSRISISCSRTRSPCAICTKSTTGSRHDHFLPVVSAVRQTCRRTE